MRVVHSSLSTHRLVNCPLVLIVEFVDLVSLHVARKNGLGACVENYWHLEQEKIVWCWWCTSHFVSGAVEVVAVSKEFTAESTEDQHVLAILLHCTATLSLRERFVVNVNLSPSTLIGLVVPLNCVNVFSS